MRATRRPTNRPVPRRALIGRRRGHAHAVIGQEWQFRVKHPQPQEPVKCSFARTDKWSSSLDLSSGGFFSRTGFADLSSVHAYEPVFGAKFHPYSALSPKESSIQVRSQPVFCYRKTPASSSVPFRPVLVPSPIGPQLYCHWKFLSIQFLLSILSVRQIIRLT